MTRRTTIRFALAAAAALALSVAAGPAAESGNKVLVEMKTNAGTVVLELWPDVAPKTVENFLRYVREGFYDGTIFHRLAPGFVIQGGGYTEDLKEKPTHEPIPLEAKKSNRKYTIAMARTNDPNSATSQFYINLADNTFLDPGARPESPDGYAVFGKVVKGQQVIDFMASTKTRRLDPPFTDLPERTLKIESMRILEQAP